MCHLQTKHGQSRSNQRYRNLALPRLLILSLVLIFVVVGFGATKAEAQQFAYVANCFSNNVSIVNTASNSVVNTVAVGNCPYGIAITPDNNFVYVVNNESDNVSVIDTSSNAVIATIPVGDRPTVMVLTRNASPTSKGQCKNGGYRSFTNPTFKNQGECVSFVQHHQ